MTTSTKERGRIVREGMGGFLNPPTHPEHTMHVETDLRRRKENRGGMALSSAVEAEWLDDATRRQARELLEGWDRPPLDSPEIRDWIARVLGYFRNCYRGADESWNAGDLSIEPDTDPLLNADQHAGVHYIRKFYPKFTPTAANFAEAYWGQKPPEHQPL